MDILIIIRSARRFLTIMVFPSILVVYILCSDLFYDSFSFIDEVDTNIIYAKIKKKNKLLS